MKDDGYGCKDWRSNLVYLHVSFTVDAHNLDLYEEIFRSEFAPVLAEHGFHAIGIWKTLVGPAGEYIEIWRFESAMDYETRWNLMSRDPRVKAILAKTGPLVRN